MEDSSTIIQKVLQTLETFTIKLLRISKPDGHYMVHPFSLKHKSNRLMMIHNSTSDDIVINFLSDNNHEGPFGSSRIDLESGEINFFMIRRHSKETKYTLIIKNANESEEEPASAPTQGDGGEYGGQVRMMLRKTNPEMIID